MPDGSGVPVVCYSTSLTATDERTTSGRAVFLSGQGYRAVWSPDEINMIAQDDPRHRQ